MGQDVQAHLLIIGVHNNGSTLKAIEALANVNITFHEDWKVAPWMPMESLPTKLGWWSTPWQQNLRLWQQSIGVVINAPDDRKCQHDNVDMTMSTVLMTFFL